MCRRIPAFFYVAPYASHVTTAEANKVSRFSLMKSFTLDSIKSFHQGQGHTGYGECFCWHIQYLRFRAVNVFFMSAAMVIGPTPPGTGVIKLHLGETSANATSPLSA